jgi:hypothetical protein
VTSARDHFPRTPRTIVFESLDEGRQQELAGQRHHEQRAAPHERGARPLWEAHP